MKFFLMFSMCIAVSNLTFAASFQSYKTEKEKIADGVILEKKISKKTGKIIEESFKIKVDGNYYEAVKKDGKWGLSDSGKAAFDASSKGGDSGGGGGGC